MALVTAATIRLSVPQLLSRRDRGRARRQRLLMARGTTASRHSAPSRRRLRARGQRRPWRARGCAGSTGRSWVASRPTSSSRPVRYFTMGPNTWQEADTWPPPDATPTSFFLRGDGAGERRRRRRAPRSRARRRRAARRVPVPPAAPRADRRRRWPRRRCVRPAARRGSPDVLVYDSPAALRAARGERAAVRRAARGEQRAFDGLHGEARRCRAGRLRAQPRRRHRAHAFRAGRGAIGDHRPAQHEHVFAPGAASGWRFPAATSRGFDRNPNTGEAPASATRFVPAHQYVHHSAEHPSRLGPAGCGDGVGWARR